MASTTVLYVCPLIISISFRPLALAKKDGYQDIKMFHSKDVDIRLMAIQQMQDKLLSKQSLEEWPLM